MTAPLTDSEVEIVRKFVPHAETISQKIEDRAAIGRVLGRYRGKIAGTVSVITVLLLVKDNLKIVLSWVMQ